MADRQEDTRVEGSSSQERQALPVVHEVGESLTRPPQDVPPPAMAEPHVSTAAMMDEVTFRSQMVAAMGMFQQVMPAVNMFTQVMQNPSFQAFLQPSQVGTQVGTQVGAQKQAMHGVDSAETPTQILEPVETPRPLPVVQEQVAETPVVQAVPVQPTTLHHPIVGSNGK